MYATCLFCNHHLGRNEVIERFPVGRRLAYDAAKGRLWVVCRHCGRWNLTPLEERWEAIEECERAFRSTVVRVATDQVALARVREGLELVRIGTPPRLELATWRYGDQFTRRRIATALGFGAAPLFGLAAGWPSWPVLLTVGGVYLGLTGVLSRLHRGFPRPPLVPDGEGGLMRLDWQDVRRARLTRVQEVGDWCLTVRREGRSLDARDELFDHPDPPVSRRSSHPLLRRFDEALGRRLDEIFPPPRTVTFRGAEAERVLGSLLPAVNFTGASQRRVREAVEVLDRSANVHQMVYAAAGTERDAESFIGALTRTRGVLVGSGTNTLSGTALGRLASPTRLALEMALHEEEERRAMEGELAALEARWREAEEIAAIADALTFPRDAAARLELLRRPRRSVSQ
ncbi:MAG TPA: hypothetical protein VF178_08155 [Gemmatimonadaceae bacterium]